MGNICIFVGKKSLTSKTYGTVMEKKLLRSQSDKKIAGVCGGMAEYFNIDATLVRLLWVFFALLGGGGLLVYIICALVIPEN